MPASPSYLSKRERQVLDVLYGRGRATAADVQAGVPDALSYSAVRSALRVLVEKGLVRHEQDGPRNVYEPTIARASAQRSALSHLLRTLFEGSRAQAVSALLELPDAELSDDELDRIARLVEDARQKRQQP